MPDKTSPTIRLKIVRRSSHPWIFQKMVEKPAEKPHSGTVVDIVDRENQWIGRGFYNGHSRIALRVLSPDPQEKIDSAFFQRRIDAAVQLRREYLGLDQKTDAYRVIHSEGDDLSGLVVDRFGPILVQQYFAAGMYRFHQEIQQALRVHYPDCQFYWFAEEHIQKQESFNCREPEPPEPVIIKENGLRFRVAPGSKHKTGFFADQRENREFLASFCEGKNVLDICCNSGGFAVYAKALGKAADVAGVDLDEQVIDLAKQNANLNQVRIRFLKADLFTWLRDIQPSGQRFDVVVLDPSKQTRDRDAVRIALKRYQDMNRLALQVVERGGLYLTCSCTGLVKEDDYLHTLKTAAWQAGRTLQILKITGAGPDHPFLVHVPESRYLKAIFCRVF